MTGSCAVLWLTALASATPPSGPPLVVGGSPAPSGAWPDAAALFTHDLFQCSAVLVAPDVALSAAHCAGSALDTTRQIVVDTVDHDAPGGVWIDVVERHVYDDPFLTFDIAAFVLAEPAPIPPRPILRDCLVEDWLVDGAEVSIVGFGATDDFAQQTTTVLHEARTVVTDADCSALDAGCNREVSPGGELIAGGEGIDSCVGDSGGPLYLHTPDVDYLVGITSRAAQPAPTVCGSGGIYVRADAIAEWVESVTGRNLERPACGQINRPPRPLAPALEVVPGQTQTVQIDPGDPNEGDQHRFSVADPPWGQAEIDQQGVLTYRASALVFAPPPPLQVRVEDQDGATGTVEVEVTLLGLTEGGLEVSGCGCATGDRTPLMPWFALTLLLVARRRR